MKVYFAGMENIYNSYKTPPKKTDNIFCTFFYPNSTVKFLKDISKDKGHEGIITIDSGAHSFFGYAGTSTAAHHNNKDKSEMPDPYLYFEKYLSFIKEHYEKISYFVELDIQAIVGMDQVWKWRERMSKEGVYDKCIPVIHSIDSTDVYKRTLDTLESGYIGLEGLRNKKINLPYMKILKECYERNIKVHGFALTASEITTKYPFFSVDSTTWTAPVRYGTLLVLDKGSLKQVGCTKANHIKYGFPVELHSTNKDRESSVKKLQYCMGQQRKYEKFLKDMWISRGIKWT